MRPLDGVRILDFTRLLPGAYATLLLSDLGADVIKIEDPQGGDLGRRMPAMFAVLNRNKKSMALDLRRAEAAAVVDALAARSDVVVDSFRPGTARRLGVDPKTLRARHPRLVCASITGFGADGPYVDRAAHDINYEALAGVLVGPDGQVNAPGALVADVGAAMQAAIGILGALVQGARTGNGAVVDISIHDAALTWSMFPWTADLASACYSLYETADGRWLALGALEPKFWRGFCERIGRPDLAARQDATGAERHRIWSEVRAIMRTRTRDEWLAVFGDADVCLTEVATRDEALDDPHFAARGLIARHEGVTYVTSPGIDVRPSPALGADTDRVLDDAGIDASERARLRSGGVIS
jgi:alpha-methylacyl-CoA racemase